MARIRSVHPGLFTDEAFVSVSAFARILAIGIWTEADDQGVFEWKPIVLKMRLFPVDHVDLPVLLEELAGADMVRRFSVDGRGYGAVRNFQRFQRPKKPNSIHPLPPEFRTYVGSTDPSSEPTDDEGVTSSPLEPVHAAPVPQKSELGPQMEDGGGIGGKKKEELSLRSGRDERGLGPVEPPPDARTTLFREGLGRAMRITGRTDRQARALIGQMLNELGDDCAGVNLILTEAEAVRPADPVPWLRSACESRSRGSPRRNGAPASARGGAAWMNDPDAFDRVMGTAQ